MFLFQIKMLINIKISSRAGHVSVDHSTQELVRNSQVHPVLDVFLPLPRLVQFPIRVNREGQEQIPLI